MIPELAAGAAAELADLRAACDGAVAHLLGSGARRIVVVGADTRTREHAGAGHGSFAPWGAPGVTVGGPAAEPPPGREPLPL
ncbi:MAG TPA: hypothetical protein VES42_22815, partial [Pilimelia sp.]|nr:hypothetical protein [Pilimelia sp.]